MAQDREHRQPAVPGRQVRQVTRPGTAFFDGTKQAVAAGGPLPLKFTRGNGLLARMLHIHAAEVDEFATAATAAV